MGERVLGLAYCLTKRHETYEKIDDIEGDFVFAGFVSLVDPPKDRVIEAVAMCNSAKI